MRCSQIDSASPRISDWWCPPTSPSAFSRAVFRCVVVLADLDEAALMPGEERDIPRTPITCFAQASRPSWKRLVPRISVLSTSKNARIGLVARARQPRASATRTSTHGIRAARVAWGRDPPHLHRQARLPSLRGRARRRRRGARGLPRGRARRAVDPGSSRSCSTPTSRRSRCVLIDDRVHTIWRVDEARLRAALAAADEAAASPLDWRSLAPRLSPWSARRFSRSAGVCARSRFTARC